MPEYGEIRVDYITYTTGTSPNEGQGTVTVSGLINNPTFSGDVIVGNDLTVSGNLNANGMTVTGTIIISGTMSGESMTLSTGIFASGAASTPSITFIDDLDTGIYAPAANEVAISTSGTGRLFITEDGNVGIGSSAPGVSLEISNTLPKVRTRDSDGTQTYSDFFHSGGSTFIDSRNEGNDGPIIFRGNGGGTPNEFMRVASNGNVGIATSSPSSKLTIRDETGGQSLLIEGSGGNDVAVLGSVNGATNRAELLLKEGTSGDNRVKFTSQDSSPSFIINNNFGIGTNSPQNTLQVVSSSTNTDETVASFGNQTINDGLEIITDGNLEWGFNAKNSRNLVFETNQNERMRIDSSGNVGINNSAPDARLDVNGGDIYLSSTNSEVIFRASNTGLSGIRAADSNGNEKASVRFQGVSSNQATSITFRTSNNSGTVVTERARIDTAGNFLVGTTTAISVNTGTVDGLCTYQPGTGSGILQISNNGFPCIYLRRRSSNGAIVQFYRDTTVVGSITVTTTNTSYNTSSDYRLKENVVPMTGAAERINALKPSRFNFIAEPKKTVDGFLAHEAQEVIPEAVTGEKDGEKMQSIDHSKLVPLLTGALQEALAKIKSLEQRLSDAGL
jgi:hypothetical protein